MKSGKYTLGYKTVLKCLRSGKGACAVPACPPAAPARLSWASAASGAA